MFLISSWLAHIIFQRKVLLGIVSESCLTASVSGAMPREPTNETENVFEPKKALKRNVAKRPTARDVRHGFIKHVFVWQLLQKLHPCSFEILQLRKTWQRIQKCHRETIKHNGLASAITLDYIENVPCLWLQVL